MASTRDSAFKHTVKSDTLSYEMNQIVIRAWSTRKIADRSYANFADEQSILISSKNDYILLTSKKERGQHYQLSFENVNDDKEKIPKGEALYTYSFYTLDPSKLNEHYQSLNKNPSVVDETEKNPERLLLKQAWGFLAACGMDKLVCIEDNPSPKFFSVKKHKGEVRKVKSTCFDSIETFGGKDIMVLAWHKYAERVPNPSCLLSNAKLAESHKIKLFVPGESRVNYYKGDSCSIL